MTCAGEIRTCLRHVQGEGTEKNKAYLKKYCTYLPGNMFYFRAEGRVRRDYGGAKKKNPGRMHDGAKQCAPPNHHVPPDLISMPWIEFLTHTFYLTVSICIDKSRIHSLYALQRDKLHSGLYKTKICSPFIPLRYESVSTSKTGPKLMWNRYIYKTKFPVTVNRGMFELWRPTFNSYPFPLPFLLVLFLFLTPSLLPSLMLLHLFLPAFLSYILIPLPHSFLLVVFLSLIPSMFLLLPSWLLLFTASLSYIVIPSLPFLLVHSLIPSLLSSLLFSPAFLPYISSLSHCFFWFSFRFLFPPFFLSSCPRSSSSCVPLVHSYPSPPRIFPSSLFLSLSFPIPTRSPSSLRRTPRCGHAPPRPRSCSGGGAGGEREPQLQPRKRFNYQHFTSLYGAATFPRASRTTGGP